MSVPLMIETEIHLTRRNRGRLVLAEGRDPQPSAPVGRVPRISRLMALAIRFEQLIQDGHVRDYAELARLSHVTRARITQIMNLLLLAPDIQAEILFLPRITNGRDPQHLRELQPIALEPVWRQQRELWRRQIEQSAR